MTTTPRLSGLWMWLFGIDRLRWRGRLGPAGRAELSPASLAPSLATNAQAAWLARSNSGQAHWSADLGGRNGRSAAPAATTCARRKQSREALEDVQIRLIWARPADI